MIYYKKSKLKKNKFQTNNNNWMKLRILNSNTMIKKIRIKNYKII